MSALLARELVPSYYAVAWQAERALVAVPSGLPDPGADPVWASGRYREITGLADLNPEDMRDLGRQRPLDRS